MTIYEDFYISFFNLVFTSFPLIVKAIFENDVNYQIDGRSLKKLYPYLYYRGAQKDIYNFGLFLANLLYAIVHVLLVFYIPRAVILESGIFT